MCGCAATMPVRPAAPTAPRVGIASIEANGRPSWPGAAGSLFTLVRLAPLSGRMVQSSWTM
jgi:hypothetical protein